MYHCAVTLSSLIDRYQLHVMPCSMVHRYHCDTGQFDRQVPVACDAM